jgi:hypothetical protein
MDTRSRLIIPVLAAAAAAATVSAVAASAVAVSAASAAPAITPRAEGCIAPRLVGLTERAALPAAHAAGCSVHLTGARLRQATVQTIAAQTPAAGHRGAVVRLTLNPFCIGSALAGPPPNEGMRPGPTELITGLYLVGGPALPYSSPRCRRKPGKPAAGTIDVLDPVSSTVVASRTVKRGRLMTFRLAPGRYRVSGSATGSTPPGPQIFARPFTIRAGSTTRRYVVEPVP